MVQPQRNTETKKKIKQSFTELLKEKGIDSLTVSDIARRSGINRGTFYLHYIDKYDLMEQLENDVIKDLNGILLADIEGIDKDNPIELIPYPVIFDALNYVKKDFEFIEGISGVGGDPMFVEKFKDILENLLKTKVDESDYLKLEMKDLPNDYAKEILLSSVMAIILLWIRKGAVESPEEIATMITKAKVISAYELLF